MTQPIHAINVALFTCRKLPADLDDLISLNLLQRDNTLAKFLTDLEVLTERLEGMKDGP